MGGDRASERPSPPIYLSLGDSLSVGVQPLGKVERLVRTDEGYPDQLRSMLTVRWPNLELVKLGCPSETTTTLIEGGIGQYARGSQLAEAEAFLEEKAESVVLITLDIGFNDFPAQDLAAVPIGLKSMARNLPRIIERLRKAAGKTIPLIGMNLYDPFLAYWLAGELARQACRMSVEAAIHPINERLGEIYASAGCPVADIESAFSTLDFETTVFIAAREGVTIEVPLNVARILEWTWAGAPPPHGPDFHANVRGYGAMAGAFAEAVPDLANA